MAVQDRTTLKSYFETGDKPTQAQFSDLIDSCFNLSEDDRANDLGFALSDETTDLTTDNDAEREVIRATTLQSLTFYVNTAPTGSSIICEVRKNTTLIETITLPAGSTTVTVSNTTTFAAGDRLKANITQVGAVTAGTGAKLEPKAKL